MSSAAKPLMSLDDALAIILSHVQSISAMESVATWDADGRALAQDLVSELAVPALDNSSMDGYALRSTDVSHVGARLRVTQRIPAGSHGQPLHAG
jgi:molybdopterin molybdotransferase